MKEDIRNTNSKNEGLLEGQPRLSNIELPPFLKSIENQPNLLTYLRKRWIRSIFVPLAIFAGVFAYEKSKKIEKPEPVKIDIDYSPERITQKSHTEHLTKKQIIERMHLENERKVAAYIAYLARTKFWEHPTLHSRATARIDGKTRAQYVYDRFINIKHKTDSGIVPYLSELFVGLVTQESKYYTRSKSHRGALGATQIMPNTYKELRVRLKHLGVNLPEDPKSEHALFDFGVSVDLAVYHIDKIIYPYLKSTLRRLRDVLDMPEDVYNRFASFVIINAYNAGQGTIKTCLNRFTEHLQNLKEKAQKDEAAALKWKYLKTAGPLELFYIFSRFSYEKKAHPLYRENASSYTFLVAAGTTTLSAFGYFKKVPQKPNMQNIGELIDNINSNSPWWVAKYGIDLNKMPEKELKKILAYAN